MPHQPFCGLRIRQADNDGRLFLALLSALMDTLVSELGGMAWRAAAAAAGSSPGTAAAGAAGAEAAVAAAQEAGVTALAALQAAMRQLAGTCVRNAVAKTAGVAAGPVMAMLAVAAEQLRTTAAATTAAVAPPGSLERVRATAGLSLAQATSAVAAGGLLEGVLATVRLQPPSSQAPLLRALQPATDRLVATLLSASSAAAVSAAEAASGASAMPGSVTAVANIASSALRQAVGYCWARLRLQPALQVSELAPAPAVVAERMAEVATLSAAAGCVGMKPPSGISGVEVASWHPARGTLEALFCGALGVGRIVSTALKGARGTGGRVCLKPLKRRQLSQGFSRADAAFVCRPFLYAGPLVTHALCRRCAAGRGARSSGSSQPGALVRRHAALGAWGAGSTGGGETASHGGRRRCDNAGRRSRGDRRSGSVRGRRIGGGTVT